MSDNQIKVRDLITANEANALAAFVKKKKAEGSYTCHNIIMNWLDGQTSVTKRFAKHHVLKAYGAYLLEYWLKL